MSARELARLFGALVASTSCHASVVDGTQDGGADAGAPEDAARGTLDVALTPDVLVDSHVAWCPYGPPELLYTDGCNAYLYVPCGLPDDVSAIDDAGTLDRCDQICPSGANTDCAMLDTRLVNTLLDSGLIFDGSMEVVPDASAAVYILCACPATGRRPGGLRAPHVGAGGPLAQYFSQAAHLEAASVPAFARVAAELGQLHAPGALVRRVSRALRDEQRHARVVGALARRFGGTVPTCGPVVRMRRRQPHRHRRWGPGALARDNAVEGCVRETFGALVATWQAVHAGDPMVRRAMKAIAADETRHAALAWDLARFLRPRLSREELVNVQKAERRAVVQLAHETGRARHPALVERAGLPTPGEGLRLVTALQAALWPGR